jgi:hypothetical protein
MTTSTPSKPLIASSTVRYGAPWTSPRAVAPSRPRPWADGSRAGSIIARRVVSIILGLALLAVAGVLMGVHLWSLRHRYARGSYR